MNNVTSPQGQMTDPLAVPTTTGNDKEKVPEAEAVVVGHSYS